MCDLLTVMDSKIVQVALNGLENILRLGEQESKQNGTGINPYCALIEEAYGRLFLLYANGIICLVLWLLKTSYACFKWTTVKSIKLVYLLWFPHFHIRLLHKMAEGVGQMF